jgi:hypothetical protein
MLSPAVATAFTTGLLTAALGIIPSGSGVFLGAFLLCLNSKKQKNQTNGKKIFQGVFHFRFL